MKSPIKFKKGPNLGTQKLSSLSSDKRSLSSKLPNFKRGQKAPEIAHQGSALVTSGAAGTLNLESHRNAVLKKGRKFKYPIRKSKHQIATYSFFFLLLAAFALAGFSYQTMMTKQSYNRFAYGLSKVFPFRVATVDGNPVTYGEYLTQLRHQLFYLERQDKVNTDTAEGKVIFATYKKVSLDAAITHEYVEAEAKRLNIQVSTSEVDAKIARTLEKYGLTNESAVEAISIDNFDWQLSDYKKALTDKMLESKVEAAHDTNAKAIADDFAARIATGTDFAELAKTQSDEQLKKASGALGTINIKTSSIHPTILDEIANLKEGQTSAVFAADDTYNIVKVNKVISPTEFDVSIIRAPIKQIEEYVKALSDSGKINIKLQIK